jgi:hypothetical protein
MELLLRLLAPFRRVAASPWAVVGHTRCGQAARERRQPILRAYAFHASDARRARRGRAATRCARSPTLLVRGARHGYGLLPEPARPHPPGYGLLPGGAGPHPAARVVYAQGTGCYPVRTERIRQRGVAYGAILPGGLKLARRAFPAMPLRPRPRSGPRPPRGRGARASRPRSPGPWGGRRRSRSRRGGRR